MATTDGTPRKRFIYSPPGLNRYGPALFALVLSALVACVPSTIAQVAPAAEPSAAQEAFSARERRAFSLLSDFLAKTERIAAFRLDKGCFKCNDRTLEVRDILPSIVPIALDGEPSAEARRLLGSKDSFATGVIKPCNPLQLRKAEGLILYQSAAVALFVVFPECQTARLVMETEIPPYFFNVGLIYSHLTSLQAQAR